MLSLSQGSFQEVSMACLRGEVDRTKDNIFIIVLFSPCVLSTSFIPIKIGV